MKRLAGSKLQTIHDLLRREIEGSCQPGDRLPTEPELAARFRCSVATISKALSLLAHDGWIDRRPRTGTKVLRVTPAAGVSSPSGLQLDALAYIYPSEKHEGIWRAVRGFQDAALEAGSRVLTLTTEADCEKELAFLGRISEFAVRGAVVHPILLTPQQHARFAEKLAGCPIPLVLSGMAISGTACPSVGADAFHAGYSVTRHLVDRGMRRIGFVTNNAGAMERYHAGYLWALEESGIVPLPSWGLLDSGMRPDYEDPETEPLALSRRYLESGPGVDGVVCPYDGLAVAMIRAAQERGLEVPRDLRVVGIDDMEAARSSPVPLTTYHMPFEEMGRREFAALQAVVAGTFSGFGRINVRGRMVVRESA